MDLENLTAENALEMALADAGAIYAHAVDQRMPSMNHALNVQRESSLVTGRPADLISNDCDWDYLNALTVEETQFVLSGCLDRSDWMPGGSMYSAWGPSQTIVRSV